MLPVTFLTVWSKTMPSLEVAPASPTVCLFPSVKELHVDRARGASVSDEVGVSVGSAGVWLLPFSDWPGVSVTGAVECSASGSLKSDVNVMELLAVPVGYSGMARLPSGSDWGALGCWRVKVGGV